MTATYGKKLLQLAKAAILSVTELEILDGLTTTTDELNKMDGATVTAAELNYLDLTGAVGVQEAIKAVIADANVNTGISKVTQLHIGATGSETQVTSTPAELNYLDLTGAVGTQEASKAVVADANVNTGVSKVTQLHIGATGSETQVTATPAELNVLDDIPASVTFAAAAGAANITEVTITVKDAAGVAIAEAFNLDAWLSDAATGVGLTGTTASGTVQAKSASGADLEVVTAKKHVRVQTLATGIFILEITDTAKTGFYVCAGIPGTGKTAISTQLVTGDYGA